MRASVCAVCPSAGLLMPGAAAIADPPWERGHQYEARGCKYEYKSGPHGFKEEYACDGGGGNTRQEPPAWRRRTAGAANMPSTMKLGVWSPISASNSAAATGT